MRKSLLFAAILFFFTSLVNAQVIVSISGYVTDSANNSAIANHPVYIHSDSVNNPAGGTNYIFNTVVYTNANGYYSVQATLNSMLQVMFYISTYDCNNVLHMVTGMSTNSPIVANFSICQGNTLLCTASFTYTVNAYTANFVATATGVAPFIYSWNFGNGLSGTGQSVNHTYTSPGLYTVTLTVTDSTACVSQYTQTVHITGQQSCTAMYQVYPVALNPLTFHFVDTSTGNPNYWTWNFGDGTSSNQQNPIHTYSQPGIYLVCLTIGNNTSSCQDTYCDSLVVGNTTLCTTSFTSSTNNMTASFNASASGIPPYTFTWNFGDGSTGTGQNPAHTYNNTGLYLVTLTTIDSTACTAVYSQNIHIVGQNSCLADFIAFPDSNNLLNIHFFDMSVGNPVSWAWNFGDGNSSSLQNPSHIYAQAGLYNVCLTILTAPANACQNTFCDSIHVGASLTCVSSFTYTANNLTLHFTGYSSLSNASYVWDFGDGSTGTSQNPVHIYNHPGTYTICLQTLGNGIICTPYCLTIQVGSTSNAGHIQGNVHMGNTFADHAIVYLIEYDSNTQILSAVDTTNLIQTGFYSFTNVPYGDYMVKAALTHVSPHYWYFLPTYHDSVLFWNQAVHVGLNGPSSTADIFLVPGNNPGGPGFIGGNVTQGANKLLGSGDAMKDVEIMLLDANNDPVTYTYSDLNGNYGIGNLPYGTYKGYAEMINRTTFPILVTLSAGQDTVTGVNIVVNKDNIVAGIGANSADLADAETNFYPNPASDYTNIILNVKSYTELKVVFHDQLGKQIKIGEYKLVPGVNTISLNISQLNDGIYYVNFISEGMNLNRKFVKIR